MLLLTTSCAQLAPYDSSEETAGLRQAEQAAVSGKHGAASRQYIELARQTRGERRQRYLILAAQELYYAKDLAGSLRLINQVEPQLTSDNLALWAEVAGQSFLSNGEPARALTALKKVDDVSDGDTAARLLLLRAEAEFRLGRPKNGVVLLVEREDWLTNNTELDANQRLIWSGLQTAGAALAQQPAPDPGAPVISGWLEIGHIAYQERSNPVGLRSNLSNWQAQNPQHPAGNVVLPEILQALESVSGYPRQTAVLLPLSGRTAASAEAIRDGILAAHFGLGDMPDRPDIRVYDTNALGPEPAYDQAVQDGADFIIGPLLKDSVSAVKQRAGRVTTLALNFSPDKGSGPRGYYEFALSPEDEARLVAQRALLEGQKTALV
ncbi:MAG: penicillin-binding protein activator, partial [Gammaproteobacteria bacterium]